jgi:pyridoxal 5'-phosphate synthase pdxT subunit
LALKVGILALQGDFAKHKQAVDQLGLPSLYVRSSAELEQCSHLIIPGGESTTLLNLIERLQLRQALLSFGRERAIMGTCAGLIILAKQVDHLNFDPLGLIDITVNRNAYGRQIDSFVDTINIHLNGKASAFEGVFIRAPKIEAMQPPVIALGHHLDQVVLAANKHILVATFHPELANDLRIHQYFLNHF